MTVVALAYLTVRNSKEREFESMMKEMFDTAKRLGVSGQLWRRQENPSQFIIVASMEKRENYASFQSSPEGRRLSRELMQLAEIRARAWADVVEV